MRFSKEGGLGLIKNLESSTLQFTLLSLYVVNAVISFFSQFEYYVNKIL